MALDRLVMHDHARVRGRVVDEIGRRRRVAFDGGHGVAGAGRRQREQADA